MKRDERAISISSPSPTARPRSSCDVSSRGIEQAKYQARQRIAAQFPAAEKASRADFVIDTSGSFESTDRQIESLLTALNSKLM